MEKTNRILILFAHPSQNRSEVNLPLFRASQEVEWATCVDLYAEYPDFRINIEREQQRLVEHDVIICMFSLYWYSTPSILKEWQDLVLEYGFAYGHHGKALAGKTFFCGLTAGGAEKAYHTDGYNHFTIRELLQPLEQTAMLTGMRYLPPYTLFSARTASEEGRIRPHIEQWMTVLEMLRTNQYNPEVLKDFNTLNDSLIHDLPLKTT